MAPPLLIDGDIDRDREADAAVHAYRSDASQEAITAHATPRDGSLLTNLTRALARFRDAGRVRTRHSRMRGTKGEPLGAAEVTG
jgi:hypothetical protein